MASEKLRRTTVREVCDAYAEGVLDGMKAEQLRQRQPKEYSRPPNWLSQLTPEGKTLESELAKNPKDG